MTKTIEQLDAEIAKERAIEQLSAEIAEEREAYNLLQDATRAQGRKLLDLIIKRHELETR